MVQRSKEPRSPVSRDRAMEHALLAIRRNWAGDVHGFGDWAGVELDPEPLIIHDLNGQVLFYEFAAMDGNRMLGSVKASASKIIGPAVVTIEFGPRGWSLDTAFKRAREDAAKRFPKAKIAETELVCYSYPKLGARVSLRDPEMGSQDLVYDVSSLSLVPRFGADEPEGFSAWSFYQNVAEPSASAREQNWELADREMEAARTQTPKILDRTLTVREQRDLKPTFVVKPAVIFTPVVIPFYSQRVIQFCGHCSAHDCYSLHAQQNDHFCAVAAGQMILDFYRYYYSQDDIAAAMGTTSSGTYNSGQETGYESLSNNGLEATVDLSASWAEAKAEIDANRPLKSGISGHARACFGWKRQNIFIIGQQPKRWLYILDPWPWNANICLGGKVVWEDWDTINHTNFIYVRHCTTP